VLKQSLTGNYKHYIEI